MTEQYDLYRYTAVVNGILPDPRDPAQAGEDVTCAKKTFPDKASALQWVRAEIHSPTDEEFLCRYGFIVEEGYDRNDFCWYYTNQSDTVAVGDTRDPEWYPA